jgi:hypothetical protein
VNEPVPSVYRILYIAVSIKLDAETTLDEVGVGVVQPKVEDVAA